MTNTLYNKYEALTEDGKDLSDEADKLLRPLMKKYTDKGYTLREISHIIMLTLSGTESEQVLLRAIQKRKIK